MGPRPPSALLRSSMVPAAVMERSGRERYIGMACAKALPEARVIWRHGARSAITLVVLWFDLSMSYS